MQERISGKAQRVGFLVTKSHVLSTRSGQIVGAILLPTSYDDRAGARVLADLMEEGSLVIADLGYQGVKFQTKMYEEEGVLFITRADIKSSSLKIIFDHPRTGRRRV